MVFHIEYEFNRFSIPASTGRLSWYVSFRTIFSCVNIVLRLWFLCYRTETLNTSFDQTTALKHIWCCTTIEIFSC
jgi:hypothetical protein